MSSSAASGGSVNGSAAAAACRLCGHGNDQAARFCSACGATLAPEEPAGARKTVTIVFTDLVGSTALGDGVDPERLRNVMADYHRELRTIFERHGGTVEKFIGDAAMAVFGLPRAHEDDALRAVRAASEATQAVARLGLEVRSGINTGEVVAAEGETLVTGDAVNVAARLQQAAAPGEVLLGELTRDLVGHAVRVSPTQPLTLKGKSLPVAAHRLIELLPGAPAFERRLETPFVGRQTELERLHSAVARALGERTSQLVTIVGPPGIGKSRLLGEARWPSSARVLAGHCLPYGQAITYAPLAEMVSTIGDVRAALGETEDAPLAAGLVEATLVPAGGGASSDEIAWAFRRLFETLAQQQPFIIVFEDLHWADQTLLELIEYVSTMARDVPLAIVCIARPELLDARPSWSLPRPNRTLIVLEPLSSAEVEQLVDELHGAPGAIRVRIVEATEGNPFFVEQLVAHLSEGSSGELAIPPSLRALLAARIDGLDSDERAVLGRGSVEGRLFHRGAVRELLPEGARPGLGGNLLALVRKGFLAADRAQLPGDDAFRFSHALVRDAVYEALPKRLRAELHERLVGWIDAKLGSAALGEVAGWHLEQAYRYRVELGEYGDRTAELGTRAGRLLAVAGRRAHARGDDRAARSLLERATGLIPEADPELPAYLDLLGSSTYEVGDAPAALDILRRAQAAAAAGGQRGAALRARMDELAIQHGLEEGRDAAGAMAEAEAAIAELERLDDPDSLARAWRAVIELGFIRSRFALVGEASARLLESARQSKVRRDEVWAVRGLAAALTYGPAPVQEAIEVVEKNLADFPIERAGEDHLALLYAFAGRDADAQAAMTRSRRVREELGQEIDLAGLSLDLGWIAILAGDPARAEPQLRAAAVALERAGEKGYLASVAALLGDVLYRTGRAAEAEHWAHAVEGIVGPEDVEGQSMWRALLAKVLARRGETAEALRLSGEAVDWILQSDGPHIIGGCLVDRAEVLALAGLRPEASLVLKEALGLYEQKGIGPLILRTRALLAGLADGGAAV